MDKLTPTMVRKVLAQKTDDGLSATSVRHVHSLIRNALADAEREELVYRNVARAVRPPALNRQERRAMTIEEGRRLVDALRGHRLEALSVCALTLGLRRGELLGLRWSDVDFEGGTLTVRQTVLRVDGQLRFNRPKTDRSLRTVPVPGPTLERLRRHREDQAVERPAAGERWQEFGLVRSP